MPSDTTDPNNRSAAEKIVGPDSASFTMWVADDAERTEVPSRGAAVATRRTQR